LHPQSGKIISNAKRQRSKDRRHHPVPVLRSLSLCAGNDFIIRLINSFLFAGAVIPSIIVSHCVASIALLPHISASGLSVTQTAGRSGLPNNRHLLSSVSCAQRTPAGLPCGMPGIGDEIEGAMQHAPQPA
jgi:hypothetical protein